LKVSGAFAVNVAGFFSFAFDRSTDACADSDRGRAAVTIAASRRVT
jgi:hypothetical protein